MFLRKLVLVAFLLGFIVPSLSLLADEGMWTFNHLPKEILKSKYAFQPSDSWTERVMKSSVRFNSGGSGSVVSSSGLVLTNHHVGAEVLQKLSTPNKNYYLEGFYAKTPADELKATDLELNILDSIEDVTARVNSVVKPNMTLEEAAKARRAEMAKIEKESFDKTGLRSDVVTLYQGGQYQIYRYRKYTDVRVVFAPEFDIAFFGGDPDNFEFPRYDLDMMIFRVYENEKPARLPHFLKWSKSGASENELIFVSGNPGRTNRLYTVSALKFLRDDFFPYRLNLLRRSEIMLQQYSAKGPEQARQAKEELFFVQNSRKAYIGMLNGLQDNRLFQSKQRAEYDLRARVNADPTLKGLSGAWDSIESVQKVHRKLMLQRSLLDTGHAFNSPLFTIARHLVRLAEEDLKPNTDRLPEYRDSNRASLEQQLFSEAPVYDDFETAKLADSMSYLSEKLGNDHRLVRTVLEGREPTVRAFELVHQTSLKKTSVRRLLAQGGKKAIDASYDPFILLAKEIDQSSRKVRKNYEESVQEPERQSYAMISRALFAAHGTAVYPDATFTLRLAFGQVKGYIEKGNPIAPWTTLGGAFEHELAHGAKEPWKLPKSWHQSKLNLDLKTPFNFVSTADIIGGNSGSPVINRDAELVGLIFDGNIHSLTSNYIYTDEMSRAVSVHSNAMLECMKKIYGAEALVTELLAP